MATHRLDALASLAAELGLSCQRVDARRLDVSLAPDVVLSFCDLEDGDTLVGFDGTPWHAHGTVHLTAGDGALVEHDELGLLTGLVAGEILVIAQYVRGELTDRWLAHEDEPLSLRYLGPGEELRVHRLADVHR